MKTYNKNIFYFILIITLSSCSTIYVPNKVNTPLFTNEGDMNASVNIGTSMFDIQGAYAFSEDMGLMVNGNAINSEDLNYGFIETGVGYFDSISKRGRVEIYGGGGMGNSDGELFSRFFVQPAIGITGNIFDGSIAVRLSNVNFLESNENGFLIEPVLTGRLGYKALKFSAQAGVSLPISETDIDFIPIIFNIGLHFDIGKMMKNF